MNPRALMLMAALLAPTAWAQEPATDSQVLAPRSFDLSNDSIKKIVRDFAASQSVPIRLAEEAPTKRAADRTIKYVPPEPPPPEPPAPRLPEAPAESPDGFFSAMVGTLIEMGLESLLDGHCVSTDP